MIRTLRPLPAALPLLLALAGLTAGPPGRLAAQLRWENDVRVSYEYDDNVREEVDDEIRARVARISLKTDLVLDDSTTNQLSLAYQGGFKSYFDLTQDSTEIADQFLHEGQAAYRRVVGSNLVEVAGGVKLRTWQDETFFLVNEDGFTRLWGGLSGRHGFSPSLAAEVGVRLSGIEFDHVDEVFGYDAWGARAMLSKRFADGVVADLTYTAEERTYDGRGRLSGPEDDPTNIFAPDRPRQEDLAHELGIGLSFLEPFGFQGRYRYRLNESNSFGFDYYSHLINFQVAQELPWRMILQLYAAVELRKFRDPLLGLVGALDVEDTDNNVLIFRLLKELNSHLDIEARYGRYRNESINLNAFYTKNVYSLGFRVSP